MRSHFSLCRTAIILLAASLASGCASSLPLARLEPVTIHARGDSGEIDAIATSIDAALADIAGRLDLPLPSRSLEIYLFDYGWEMRNFLREHCPEQSGKAAACFSRRGGFSITVVKSSQLSKTERALRHELTHYLLASHYRDVPRWIDEGIAQYMESTPSEQELDKIVELTGSKAADAEGTIVQLVSLPADQPLDAAQYRISGAFTQFLIHQEGFGLARIKSYLAQVEADRNSRRCFESLFGSAKDVGLMWDSFLAGPGIGLRSAETQVSY